MKVGGEGHVQKHAPPQFSALVTGATLKHPQLRTLLLPSGGCRSPSAQGCRIYEADIDCELSFMAGPR